MESMQMPPEHAAMEPDEATILGHRLLKVVHRLRSKRHCEQLIALAERLADEEERCPGEPDD